MNQTTSKCGAWCYYYFNGQCTKPDECVSNYKRLDSNNSINESCNYNPYSGELSVPNHPSGLAIGKAIIPPKTIQIDCKEIYLTKGALEIKFDLTELDFNDISQIIINGVKFNKEQ